MNDIWRLIFFSGMMLCVSAQYMKGTPLYTATIKREDANLVEEISSNEDVNFYFHPERKYLDNNGYVFNFPYPEYYRLSVLVDPCRFNTFNCCTNVFGSPEYPSLKIVQWEQERVFKPQVLASDKEIQWNYQVIDEDGDLIPQLNQRSVDDDAVIDYDCISYKQPYTYCMGRNYAYRRSNLRPPCFDNNSTLNALSSCFYVNGTLSERCVQIAYTQNTYIPKCIDVSDPHCGTFIEIHMPNGSPYNSLFDVIADVRIPTHNTSGFSTTIITTTWMRNVSRVLCSYVDYNLHIGDSVYIKASAPVCCCMKPFKPATRVGSFFCPAGVQGSGPFANVPQSVADRVKIDASVLSYPFCHSGLNEADIVMCSVYDPRSRRHFSRNCSDVEWINQDDKINRPFYSSIDLDGKEYHGFCPYSPGCALTLDAGKCKKQDYRFTFIGRVGIVTALDNEVAIPKVWVSFNGGRTSYEFDQEMVTLETIRSMYELWWVVRSPSEKVVQKRKGFNVTYPTCTFDLTNNRFFPYAQIDITGTPIDSSLI